jgi:hypothetical protein
MKGIEYVPKHTYFKNFLGGHHLKKENIVQREFIQELSEIFEDCIILKNDPTYIQGFPDLTFLWRDKWAVFETKKSSKEPYQPNQEFYIKVLNGMSFSRAVYPENKEEVLYDLQQSFLSRGTTRIFKR